MSGNDLYAQINETKAQMNHIYNEPDPTPYCSELNKLDYRIPDVAKPIFEKLISLCRRSPDRSLKVLDLGCSYGINAAILQHDMTMSELFDHWGPRYSGVTTEGAVAYNKQYFDGQQEQRNIEIIGLDPAERAVAFAEAVGLIDEGIAIDLETQPIPEFAQRDLASIDLVTSTGCVGYVTEKSFERLLPSITRENPAWIANFVLRLFPFDAIDEALSKWGYVTEKLEGRTFVQRRFANDEEQEQMLKQLDSQGIDPTGKEAEGFLHAEFYLSRPVADAEETSLTTLLAA